MLALGGPVRASAGRMDLGDHSPQDVIAGLVLGAALVAVYAICEPRVAPWLARQAAIVQVTLVIAVASALTLVHLTTNTSHVIGVFVGFYTCLVVEERTLRFDARAPW